MSKEDNVRKTRKYSDEEIEEYNALFNLYIAKIIEKRKLLMAVKRFVEQYKENKGNVVLVKKLNISMDEKEEFRRRLDYLTRTRQIPFIRREGNTLYITPSIIKILGYQGATLQRLEKIFGGKYIPKKQFEAGNRVVNIPVIEVDLDTLVDNLWQAGGQSFINMPPDIGYRGVK